MPEKRDQQTQDLWTSQNKHRASKSNTFLYIVWWGKIIFPNNLPPNSVVEKDNMKWTLVISFHWKTYDPGIVTVTFTLFGDFFGDLERVTGFVPPLCHSPFKNYTEVDRRCLSHLVKKPKLFKCSTSILVIRAFARTCVHSCVPLRFTFFNIAIDENYDVNDLLKG